jgi:hypothetical protein
MLLERDVAEIERRPQLRVHPNTVTKINLGRIRSICDCGGAHTKVISMGGVIRYRCGHSVDAQNDPQVVQQIVLIATVRNRTAYSAPMRSRNFALASMVTASLSAQVVGNTLASHPVVIAVHHGDCLGAVKLINSQTSSIDDQTAFLAGRMLDEGVCVQKDSASAAQYFARAADLGDKSATIEYGAKIGLGQGADQSYERAGIMCRSGGLDQEAKIQTYALGYACTVGELTGTFLRVSLPKGAISTNGAALVLTFSPASSSMTVKSTPSVRLAASSTGSYLRTPLINVLQEINRAWHEALAAAPKPDPTLLNDEPIVLPIDVDMTLEIGREALNRLNNGSFGTLLPSDVLMKGQTKHSAN